MAANFRSNPAGSRSRFMSNFEANRSVEQQGVDEYLWSNMSTQRGANRDLGQARTGGSYDSLAELNGRSTRPASSSSRFANTSSGGGGGGGGFGDAISDEFSPARQRNTLNNPTAQQSRVFDYPPLVAAHHMQMDPTASAFNHRAPSSFQSQMRTNGLGMARESLQHTARHASSNESNLPTLWDVLGDGADQAAMLANSQAVSRNNSQAASRNSSLPPSRHGLNQSPTESTFSSGTFGGLRSSSFVSDRPGSGDQHITMMLGQMSMNQNRQPLNNFQSSASDSFRMQGHPAANGGASQRHGSIGSRSNASEAMSRINEFQQMSGQAHADYDPAVPYPQGQTYVMGYDNDCPTLSTEARQNGGSRNHADPVRFSGARRGGGGGGRFGGYQQQSHRDPFWSVSGLAHHSSRPASVRGQGSVSQETDAAAGTHDDSLLEQQAHAAYHNPGTYGTYGSFNGHGSLGLGTFDSSSSAHGLSARAQYPGQAALRTARPFPTDQLMSGPNWTERVRPATSQRCIETSPDCCLRDVLGYVARFCGDQSGSRFLQDQLQGANTDDKEAVFQELLPNTIQLCSDPFGNYVIQKFFEHGTQRQKEQLANMMRGRVRDLSLNGFGCRCIQKAFEHVLVDQQATLVQELRPCLFEVSKHSHGNHVIQKAIERLPRDDIQFILHGYRGRVMEMSVDQFGCRVIQRLIETPDDNEAKAPLIQEILQCADHLVDNGFGNYVVQHVIDYGRPSDISQVVKTLMPRIIFLVNNKFASNVVEKCLRMGTDEDRNTIVRKVAEVDPETRKPRHLRNAMTSSYSNYVIQRLLKTLPESTWRPFAALLEQEMEAMKTSGQNDRKLDEFSKLIAKGPPDAAAVAAQAVNDPKRETRQSRSSTNASTTRPQHSARRANRPQMDDAFTTNTNAGTPPPLTRTEPSPRSTSTPSTHDSIVDGAVDGIVQRGLLASDAKPIEQAT